MGSQGPKYISIPYTLPQGFDLAFPGNTDEIQPYESILFETAWRAIGVDVCANMLMPQAYKYLTKTG